MGSLAKYQGDLGGLHDVSVHVGREPWVSTPPPMWRSAGRALVATVVRGAARRKQSASIAAWKCLGYRSFNSWRVHASLADSEASRSICGGTRFLGALSKTVFCHVIFFRYLSTITQTPTLTLTYMFK